MLQEYIKAWKNLGFLFISQRIAQVIFVRVELFLQRAAFFFDLCFATCA